MTFEARKASNLIGDLSRLVAQKAEKSLPRVLLEVGRDEVPDLEVLLVAGLGQLEVAELGHVLVLEGSLETGRALNQF